ncbi:MAG: ABC transporter ATP-binding protein [Sphingobacteriales bacterium SCN 48-20]|mgnify:CR=1 FL=1|jgi:ATP-binding cassette subfamily B protein|uniref:ABC transporter ATP-binding protein n=1 Tax=Terrimonas ferruginea TaxID=249 RepID=UPI00086E94C5|nr:ABC transporter ATP-binding protein [Terrimonas ferruginea]MBN8785412.1 ABC transporter ATP-binding protein [Terrimonas ferruginea]ODT90410.1 MAG: ABC transporter ATP-binding protein [Sphingobacteriales bacterium SCN 48-20]OJW43470.1 MAG: ABC transporter ATP-binding protein [Sphingobacteriales bacterium 48-107]
MKILLHYLKPHKWLVLLVMSLATINIGFSLVDPILLGKLINRAADYLKDSTQYTQERFFNSFSWNDMGVWFILVCSISVAMVSRIAKNFQDYFLNVVIQKFGAKVFTDGLQQAMKLPYQEFEDQRSGETLSVLTKVRADVEKFMINFINILFGVIIGVIFVFVYAAIFINWRIPVAYFIGVAVLTFVTNILSKKIKVIQKEIVGQTTALAGSTTESLRNIELVKSLGLTHQEVERLNRNTYKILGLELTKVKRIRSISFTQGTMVNTLRQVILFILMWLIFQKDMDAGQLVTMQIFSFFVFGPLQEIGNILLSYREAEASLQNFHNLMQKTPEREPANPLPLGRIETLSFRNVSFKHQTASQKAINNISFNTRRGETLAFVGPSGSGKSTLMKLLVGLYRPQEGKILYNNLDENSLRFDDLRNQIGFVTQDTNLFSGTIRENLLFVNPAATEEDVLEALTKASCLNLLARAEKGLDTMIGEGGLKLSGGEKQRLSIARALLRKPKLLLFDEATSALDSITEEEITNTIRDISSDGDQITILIAHRLSTIMHADRIYVLEKGDIVETGTHEELLEEKGLYYAMWRQQIGERKSNKKLATGESI